MFTLLIEKRISARRNGAAADGVDWYVLLAVVVPFAPAVGFEIQLKEYVFATMERVVYNPSNATFWAQTEPLLHPKPNAEQVAKELVEHGGWDRAVVEKDLKAVKVALHAEAMRKLQQLIIQAQTKVAIAGAQMSIPLHGPGGLKRKR